GMRVTESPIDRDGALLTIVAMSWLVTLLVLKDVRLEYFVPCGTRRALIAYGLAASHLVQIARNARGTAHVHTSGELLVGRHRSDTGGRYSHGCDRNGTDGGGHRVAADRRATVGPDVASPFHGAARCRCAACARAVLRDVEHHAVGARGCRAADCSADA